MSLSLKGTLFAIEAEKKINESFTVMGFVIYQEEQNNTGMVFTNHVKFQASNNICNVVKSIPIGSPIEVFFGVRGSVFEKDGEKQYFNNLNAYKIVPIQVNQYQQVPQNQAPQPQQMPYQQQAQQNPAQQPNFNPNQGEDGLPF